MSADKRKTRKTVTWNGRTQSVIDWAAELGINPKTLHDRIRRLPLNEAIEGKILSVGDARDVVARAVDRAHALVMKACVPVSGYQR